MLTNCPECSLQVSDKAMSCPHCGYPMQKTSAVATKSKSKKKMRLPNGFGQISEIKNKRLRNRFRASVTVGKRSDGSCITKILSPKGYFETYNEAYEALVEYNRNPYSLMDNKSTVKMVFEKWSSEYFSGLKRGSSIRTIKSSWSYCSSVYDIPVSDIRSQHIKYCIDNGVVVRDGVEYHTTPNIKGRIKSLFNLLLDYALENDLVQKNYARTFNISDDVLSDIEQMRNAHLSFKEEEMEKIWSRIDRELCADILLIQCYSGWRPQELGNILLENVDLVNWTFTGGMKTKAGTNRKVPIHTRIRPLVLYRYNEAKNMNSKYLFNCTSIYGTTDTKLTYDKYRHRFDKLMSTLGLTSDHRPHDGRKHFITMAKKYEVDEYAIKYIVGHAISDLTEKTYTDREFGWLKTEIEKIK